MISKTIKISFTKNDLIGSKIIRKISSGSENIQDIPSHIAWVFFDKFVVESTFPFGMKINYYDYFSDKHAIVKEFVLKEDVKARDIMLKMVSILDKYYGMGYDHLGVFYQAGYILLMRLIGRPISKKNAWEERQRVSCQEIFKEHFGIDTSLSTPLDLMRILEKDPKWERVHQ